MLTARLILMTEFLSRPKASVVKALHVDDCSYKNNSSEQDMSTILYKAKLPLIYII